MKLGLRVAVATITAAVLTILTLLSIDASDHHEEGSERLIATTLNLLDEPGEQGRCEANPSAWTPQLGQDEGLPVFRKRVVSTLRIPQPRIIGGDERILSIRGGGDSPGPPPMPPPLDPQLLPIEFFILNADLRAANPGGPTLASRYARELAWSKAVVLPSWWWSDSVEVVVQAPWRGGPCTYVYAHGHLHDVVGTEFPLSWLWLPPLVGIVCAVLIAIAPVVRRVRRLTEAVTSSGTTGLTSEVPVEGGDEIAELARSVAAAGRAARAQLSATEQRESILRDFLANTTHDVMIPLTVLQSHLATMQEHEQEGRPRDSAILTSAMDEAHYLGALVHNLAAAARLDAGAVDPVIGTVDLNALVQRVVSRHRTIARRLDIAVDFSVPDDAVATPGDVTLVEQAVSNVVYNAVRHNRPGGHVAVILETGAGDRFSLRVIDDGPGIPAEKLSRLVDRGFRRTDAHTRSPDGHGLGLNIALRVAELHRFDLRFSPSESGGLQVDLEGPQVRFRSEPPGAG